MTNEEVSAVLRDCQQFWIKWRDHVPAAESDTWEEINWEASRIILKYGKRQRNGAFDGEMKQEEEYAVGKLVFWFLDELEQRSKDKLHG